MANRGMLRRLSAQKSINEKKNDRFWANRRSLVMLSCLCSPMVVRLPFQENLNDTAMGTNRLLVIRLIQKPESVPLVSQGTKVFRRINQLACPHSWVGIVNGYKASDACTDKKRQKRRRNKPTHDNSSVKTVCHSFLRSRRIHRNLVAWSYKRFRLLAARKFNPYS